MGTKTITSYTASEWSFYRTPGSDSFDEFEAAPGDDGVRLILQGENTGGRYNVSPGDPAVVEYAGLGDLENVTIVAKFTASDVGEIAYGWPGAAIHGRLPGSTSHGAMVSITTESQYGSPKLEIAMSLSDETIDTIAATSSLPFTEWNDGEGVWLRLRLSTYSTGDGGTRVQARCWKDGDTEPASWQLDGGSSNNSSNLYLADAPGGIGFGNQSQVSTSYGSNQVDDYVRKYLDVTSITVESDEFTGVFPQSETNHIRASVSEDAGSLLDSVSLNAVDASFSEAFLLDVSLASTTPKNFVEVLAPATVAARYYPLPRQSTEFLNDYSGETILSRMARTYPPAVMAKVADLGLTTFTNDAGTTLASPKEILTHFFSTWATEYAWFGYETVPDLRLKVESQASTGIMPPSEYDDVTDQTASTDAERREYGIIGGEVVFFPQDDDNKLTMRQIVDELLAPFPGTVLRVNASGNLEIVPTYGPDATDDASPVVTLSDKDAYTVTTGQPDPSGVINKCIVRSQPYVWTEDAGAFTQSWFQITSNQYPGVSGGSIYASGTGQDLSSSDTYPSGWTPANWQMQSNTFLDTNAGVKLTDSLGNKQVTIDYQYSYTTGTGSGSVSASDITLIDIPGNGEWVEAIRAQFTVQQFLLNFQCKIAVDARYDAAKGEVQFRLDQPMTLEGACFFDPNCLAVNARINLLDASDAWQADSKTVSGEYSENNTGDNPIPTTTGGFDEAAAASVATYGTREASFDVTGYGLSDAAQLNRMARAFVLDAIQPQLVRTVEQSVWRAFPIKFSHMGEPVQLPSGEVGRVVNRAYIDDFGSNYGQGTLASTVKVEVTDTSGAGSVDTTTVFLKLDDGTPFVLDDGSTSEVG